MADSLKSPCIGDVVSFNCCADNNIAIFCHTRNITAVVVGEECNRYVVQPSGFDASIYVGKTHIDVLASKDEINLVNYGVI